MKIKDYLLLKEILMYLEAQKEIELEENNGYSNNIIEKLKYFTRGLEALLVKLETED